MSKISFSILLIAALITSLAPCSRADADDEAAPVKVETEVPVGSGKISVATMHEYVEGYGTVEAQRGGNGRAAGGAKLTSPTAGVVIETPLAEGQVVNKGDLVFRLDSRAADLAVAAAEKNLARQQQLMTSDSTSPRALAEAEQQLAAARVQQSALRIESPVSGIVMSYNARVGEMVDTTAVVAEIVDPGHLEVALKIPSREAGVLATNQPATVFAPQNADPGKERQSVAGTVRFISPAIEAATDSVVVRVSLPPETQLRSGQFVEGRITAGLHADCLAVPQESISNQEGTNVIYAIQGGKATLIPVTTGLRENGLVEVTGDGLKAGMDIVTTGAYALPAGTKLRVSDH